MRKLIQPRAAQGAGSVYITIEKQSHIIIQMRHYKNGSLVSLLKLSTVLAVFILKRTLGFDVIRPTRSPYPGNALRN